MSSSALTNINKMCCKYTYDPDNFTTRIVDKGDPANAQGVKTTSCFDKSKFNSDQIGTPAMCLYGQTNIGYTAKGCAAGKRKAYCVTGRPNVNFIFKDQLEGCRTTKDRCQPYLVDIDADVKQALRKTWSSKIPKVLTKTSVNTKAKCCGALINRTVVNGVQEVDQKGYRTKCKLKGTKQDNFCEKGDTFIGFLPGGCRPGYRMAYCREGKPNTGSWVRSTDMDDCYNRYLIDRDYCYYYLDDIQNNEDAKPDDTPHGLAPAASTPTGKNCTKDSECPEEGDTCVKGKCQGKTRGCVADQECDDGYLCKGGKCVEDTEEERTPSTACKGDSDCADKGTDMVCRKAKCITDPDLCTDNADCEDGKVCLTNNGKMRCSKCTDTKQCDKNMGCKKDEGECVACKSGECSCKRRKDCPKYFKCKDNKCKVDYVTWPTVVFVVLLAIWIALFMFTGIIMFKSELLITILAPALVAGAIWAKTTFSF